MIRPITPSDAPSICKIYNHYIENTIISFEYDAVSIDEMQQRILAVTANYPWLVYEEDGEISAFIYANLWKTRVAYKHVVESTVYVSHTLKTRGVGNALYLELLACIEDQQPSKKIKSLMAVIALPNDASIGLHKKMGFKEAGYFSKVGYKFGEWIDVVYYQKML